MIKFKEFLIEEKTYKPTNEIALEAKKAINWKEKYPNEVNAGTRVGWIRASQLSKRENISLDIVKRMYSFFSRHEGNEKLNPKYKNEPWKDRGYVSWLIWGGDPGYKWAKEIVENEK